MRDEHHAPYRATLAQQALIYIGQLYEIERVAKTLSVDARARMRTEKSKPLLDALHQWMLLQRQRVSDGGAAAKALDYSLRRWVALTRFVEDGRLPIDNSKRPPIPVPHLNAAAGCDRSRQSGVVGLPAVRQQFVDPIGALRWQPREDILQVGIRVVPIHAG